VLIPVLAISAIATVLMAAPARAQTYDPNYPVCPQIYDIDGGYIECITKPYFASLRYQQRRRAQ